MVVAKPTDGRAFRGPRNAARDAADSFLPST